MITIADRQYNKLCQISFDGNSDLIAYDDKFSQPGNSDLSIYVFNVFKKSVEIEKISVGSIVYVQDDIKIRVFEIVRIESNNESLEVFCVDGGLDFINEEKGAMINKESKNFESYVHEILFDSGWEIGRNEIPDTVKRKLSYDSTESSASRLHKVAKAFNAEVEYTFDLNDAKIVRRLINFYPKGSRSKSIRLEYGYEINKIVKTESIEGLATALRSTGEGVDLYGFEVPEDERDIWRVSDGVLIHLPSTKNWSRHGHNIDYDGTLGPGYILAHYESTAKTQKTLYQATKEQLLKRCFPEITYEVDVSDMPERVRRGDIVDIVDHDFIPAITIRGRVASVDNVSFIDQTTGTIVITNFENVKFSRDTQIDMLRERIGTLYQNLSDIPYVLEIQSSNGTSFKQHAFKTTLVARVTRNDIDVTNQFKYFKWKKVSEFSDIPDSHWNEENSQVGRSIEVSHDDVGKQSTFFCYALKDDKEVADGFIVIKSMATRLFEGETPPERPDVGDYWFQRKGKYTYMHIWDGSQWQLLIDDENLDKVSNVIKEVEKQVETIEKQIEASDSNAVKAIEEFEKKLETFKDDIIHEGLPPHVLETALTDAGFDKETIAQLKKKALANSDTLETVVDLLGSDGRTTYNRNRATITHGDIPLGTESLSVGHNGEGFEIGKPYVISWEAVCHPHASSDVPFTLNAHHLLPVSVFLRPRNTLYPTVEKTLHGASETIYAVYHDTYTVTATSDWYHTIAGRTVTIADSEPVVLSLLFKEIADGNLENKYIGEWSNSPEIILHGGTR